MLEGILYGTTANARIKAELMWQAVQNIEENSKIVQYDMIPNLRHFPFHRDGFYLYYLDTDIYQNFHQLTQN